MKEIIPKNLDEAIIRLIADNENVLNTIPKDENSFIGQFHHNVGMHLRNNWGLWTGSKLRTWFKNIGIHHADDMSGIIMISFHRRINCKNVDLEGQIKKYRDYWNKVDPKVNEGKFKENETILSEVLNYIRSAKIGDLIFRRNLVEFGNGGSTVDNYRNYLTHAGYLKTRKSGMYEYMKEIPEDMTYKRLVREAYPGREWTR